MKYPPCVLNTDLLENLALPRGVILHWTFAGFSLLCFMLLMLWMELFWSQWSPSRLTLSSCALAEAHLASSVPCAAFLGNHCCPQRFQMSREVAWSILGELHRRGLGFCTERQETGSTLNLCRCIQGLNSQVPRRGEHSSNCSFTEMKSQS